MSRVAVSLGVAAILVAFCVLRLAGKPAICESQSPGSIVHILNCPRGERP